MVFQLQPCFPFPFCAKVKKRKSLYNFRWFRYQHQTTGGERQTDISHFGPFHLYQYLRVYFQGFQYNLGHIKDRGIQRESLESLQSVETPETGVRGTK